jgi:hypothetical protein
LAEVAKGENMASAIAKYRKLSDAELTVELKKIVAENQGQPFNALIGKAMAKLRGKAESKDIIDTLKKSC